MAEEPPSPTAPSPEPDPTGSLARRGRTGDTTALGVLYGRLQPSLYAWACLRIRPEFRRALAPEDIVQETWLRAASILESYDPERVAFRPWLFRVAKNILFEWQRRLHRTWKDGGPDDQVARDWILDQIPDDVTSVTARLRRDEAIHGFLAWVAGLPDEDRQLLLHCGFEGLTLAEVASRLDVSKDAVTKRWQRLRERIGAWTPPPDLLGDP